MDSLSLRHFPEYDPPASRSSAASEEIAQQVAEYLSRGGAIMDCGNRTSLCFKKETREGRKERIRRRSWVALQARAGK